MRHGLALSSKYTDMINIVLNEYMIFLFISVLEWPVKTDNNMVILRIRKEET